MEQVRHIQLAANGKKIDIYPCASPDRPVIYLNTVSSEGREVWQMLAEMNCPEHSLVTIGGLQWNHDMSPWEIPPIAPNDTPCTGGADGYLKLLTDEIVPQSEKAIPGEVPWRGLAGYSLAGLFAVYAIYRTKMFSRIASISGSLWFPGFREYAISHQPVKKPECLYFSLGDRERKTRNPYLQTVQSSTEELAAYYKDQQINSEFQLNSGGHFAESVKRTALGIQWLLTR